MVAPVRSVHFQLKGMHDMAQRHTTMAKRHFKNSMVAGGSMFTAASGDMYRISLIDVLQNIDRGLQEMADAHADTYDLLTD
jgi:hypothetical protein